MTNGSSRPTDQLWRRDRRQDRQHASAVTATPARTAPAGVGCQRLEGAPRRHHRDDVRTPPGGPAPGPPGRRRRSARACSRHWPPEQGSAVMTTAATDSRQRHRGASRQTSAARARARRVHPRSPARPGHLPPHRPPTTGATASVSRGPLPRDSTSIPPRRVMLDGTSDLPTCPSIRRSPRVRLARRTWPLLTWPRPSPFSGFQPCRRTSRLTR